MSHAPASGSSPTLPLARDTPRPALIHSPPKTLHLSVISASSPSQLKHLSPVSPRFYSTPPQSATATPHSSDCHHHEPAARPVNFLSPSAHGCVLQMSFLQDAFLPSRYHHAKNDDARLSKRPRPASGLFSPLVNLVKEPAAAVENFVNNTLHRSEHDYFQPDPATSERRQILHLRMQNVSTMLVVVGARKN